MSFKTCLMLSVQHNAWTCSKFCCKNATISQLLLLRAYELKFEFKFENLSVAKQMIYIVYNVYFMSFVKCACLFYLFLMCVMFIYAFACASDIFALFGFLFSFLSLHTFWWCHKFKIPIASAYLCTNLHFAYIFQ